MAAWPLEHDENVAQTSCLQLQHAQAGSLRYVIFVAPFLALESTLIWALCQMHKRIPSEEHVWEIAR